MNEINNCGLVALKNISSLRDISIRTLIDIAEDNGLKLYPYKVSKGDIDLIELPAILHSKNHFSYIVDKNDLDKTDFTGEFLLTKEANYEPITGDDLKNIVGASWVAVGVASGVGAKIYDEYQSSQKEKTAQGKLDALNQEALPQETVSPELAQYHQMALSGVQNPQGLTAGEKANYNQNVTNNVNTQAYNATNTSGGNLSRYIKMALQPSSIASANNLVGQDQSIKRQNVQAAYGRLGSSTSAIQGISNTNANNLFRRRTMIEQALGGSIANQDRYQMETMDSMGNDLIGAGTNLGMAQYYKKNGIQQPNPYATRTPYNTNDYSNIS